MQHLSRRELQRTHLSSINKETMVGLAKNTIQIVPQHIEIPQDHNKNNGLPKKIDVANGQGEGRRAEFNALHRAYISTETSNRQGKPQIAVVTGASGIGKSYFVNQSLNIICNDAGLGGDPNSSLVGAAVGNFVVSGKCNEMNQNQPYSCIIDALGMLCRQLCDLDLILDSIQQEITLALNNEGQVLIDFVPAMMDVIGEEHEEVVELKGRAKQIRLERVVRRFIAAVASYCPVVIVLDDLQWVDGPTMDLLRSLATSTNLQGLLLVCIHRDNDADAKRNMLEKYFLQLKGEQCSVSYIKIRPLESMRGLIDSSRLDLDQKGLNRLAKFLHTHTDGNTFFAVRLLDYLLSVRQENILWFDPSSQLISELEKIPTLEDLLAIEINALPLLSRDVLIRAACIGYYFDDFTLEQTLLLPCIGDEISRLPSFQRRGCMSGAVAIAKGMGLVEQVGDFGYRFIHDSLWKAFYTMLPQLSRNKLHLEIGRVMKAKLRPSKGDCINEDSKQGPPQHITIIHSSVPEMDNNGFFVDRYLCSTVDQLNRGKDLMNDVGEIVELLMMNIKAAELSASDCSWKSALQYLEQITPMLRSDTHWACRYELCLVVNTMYAEINLSLCNFEATKSTVEIILRNGKSIDDTYDAYLLYMRSINSQKRTSDALSIALGVLNKLGVEADWLHQGESVEKDKFRAKTQKLVKKISSKRLAALPLISDERKLKAIKIFYWLLIAVYGTDLHELVSGKIFQLSIEYGLCEESVNGILTYASGYLPDKNKNEISRAAGFLHEQLNTEKLKHDYCLILGGYLQCWSDPLRDSLAF